MTKINKALQIFEANINSDRKVVIQLIVDTLNVTKSNASVYYGKCKVMVESVPTIKDVGVIKDVEPIKIPSKKEPYDYGEDFVVPAFLLKSYQRLGWID